ncbi:MAG TPA: hypothetical protein VML75_19975 [Kofleriaceae bacterium]|nr:hypothetical protein [Kofleriaceae bacterium]
MPWILSVLIIGSIVISATPARAEDPAPAPAEDPPAPVASPAPAPVASPAPAPDLASSKPESAPRREPGRPLLGDTYYELGAIFVHRAFRVEAGSIPMKLGGIRLYERRGVAAKALVGWTLGLIAALTSSNRKYVGSDDRYHYYREKSEAEKQRDAETRAGMVGAAMAHEYQMDLQIYWPQGDGLTQGRGFSWSITPFTWTSREPGEPIGWSFELAFLLSHIRGDVGPMDEMTGDRQSQSYSNFGMPIRFVVPVTRLGYLDVQYDWNWLGWGRRGAGAESALRLSATINPVERGYLRGGVVSSEITGPEIGYTLEAGLRF